MERLPKVAGAGPLADYAIGSRVMTVEGYPGKIDDILEGPADLTTYFVTLDNNMGGGEYAEAEISPLSEPSTASRIDASVERTAADDYPELGSILTDRLPPALHTTAAKQATSDEARDWNDAGAHEDMEGEGYLDPPYAEDAAFIASRLAAYVDTPESEVLFQQAAELIGRGNQAMAWVEDDLRAVVTALNDSPSVFSLDFAEQAYEGQCETCGHAKWKGVKHHHNEQPQQVAAKLVARCASVRLALHLPPVPPGGQRASTTDLTPKQKAGYDEGFRQGQEGVTRNPSDPEDEDFRIGFDIGWAEGVTVLREPAFSWDIEDLGKDQTADLPPATVPSYSPGMMASKGPEVIATLDSLWSKEAAGQNGGTPSYDWCRFRKDSHCYLPKELNEAASQQAGYAVWVPFHRGYCHRSAWVDQQKCPVGEPGPNSGAGGFTDATVPWEEGGQRGGTPSGTWASKTAAFEVTAKWRDIQAKAKRIRSEGGVRLVAVNGNVMVGHVKGDNGVYETEIVSMPGKRNAASWHCGCKWSSYSWGRSGPWKKFEGRMCSHALALQYEAQSRGAHGREMTLDEKQPAWMDAKHVHRPGDFDKSKQRYSQLQANSQLRPVLAQDDDEAPPHEMLAHVLMREGAKYQQVRQALLDQGVERPVEIIKAARKTTFWGRVRDRLKELVLDDDGVKEPDGHKIPAREVLYPKWHPTKGLQVNDNTPLRLGSRDPFAEGSKGEPPKCTCFCEECWKRRDDCECPDGPSGTASGSCPVHGWQAESSLSLEAAWQTEAGAKGDLPEGLEFKVEFLRGYDGEALATAYVNGEPIAGLRWNYHSEPSVVQDLFVEEPYRRRGVATALWNWVKTTHQSDLEHSTTLTDDGRAFRQTLGAKDQRVPPSEHGDPRLQDAGVSVSKTKDGKYYVHTHRARGKHRDSVSSIPDSEIEEIRATGAVATGYKVEFTWALPPMSWEKDLIERVEVRATAPGQSSLAVGALSLELYEKGGERYFHVAGLGVERSHRRKGVATAMWAAVHDKYPGVKAKHSNWPGAQTSDAKALNQTLKQRFPGLHEGAKQAMPVGPMPEGLRWSRGPVRIWGLKPKEQYQVTAKTADGEQVGHIRWVTKDYKSPPVKAGEVLYVFVRTEYRRRGIATELLRKARLIDPRVHHSEVQTDEGKEWAQVAASKTAALYTEQDLRAAWESSPEAQSGMSAEQALAQVYHEQEPDLFPPVTAAMFGYSDEDMQAFLEERKNDPVSIMHRDYDDAFLATIRGLPVGQLTYTIERDERAFSEDDEVAAQAKGDHNGYYVRIDALAVDRHARRRGVGTALLKAFIEHADKRYGFGTDPKERKGWDPGQFTKDGAALWKAVMHESVPVTQRIWMEESKRAAAAEGPVVNLTLKGHLWGWSCPNCTETQPGKGYLDHDNAKELAETHGMWCYDLDWGDTVQVVEPTVQSEGAKTPPAVLYHYTSTMHLPAIIESGHLRLTESNIEFSGAGPRVVWLTTTPTGDGNGVYGFKSAVKITVRTQGLPLKHWPTWAFEQGIEPIWYDALAQAAEGDPENWWVCTSEIPLSQVLTVEVNGRSYSIKQGSATTDFLDALNRMDTNPHFQSPTELIREYGKHWRRKSNDLASVGLEKGPMGHCFNNALNAVIANRDLIYCEGYTNNRLFPMHHAWVVDGNGTVFDPTWEDGTDYYGIPFNTDWLVRYVHTSGYSSVMGTDFPTPGLKVLMEKGIPYGAINRTGAKEADVLNPNAPTLWDRSPGDLLSDAPLSEELDYVHDLLADNGRPLGPEIPTDPAEFNEWRKQRLLQRLWADSALSKQANLSCPVCGKDVDTWLDKDGLVRKHNRPVEIPGGVSAVNCSGSGQQPEEAEIPQWIRDAFGKESALDALWAQASAQTLWHVTDNPRFEVDPEHEPGGGNGEVGIFGKGLFLTTNPELWHYVWAKKEYGTQVYAAEVEAPAARHLAGPNDDRDQYWVDPKDYDTVKVKRVIPIKQAETIARRAGYGFAMLAVDAVDRTRICVVDHAKGWGNPTALCGGVTDGNPLKWTTVAWVKDGPLTDRICPECLTALNRKTGSLTKRADEDQCPFDASDSLVHGGFYVCEEGHAWHPDEPAAKRYHGDEQHGIIQPIETSQYGQFLDIPALMVNHTIAKKDDAPTVSGVALKAADTGRILMLQRGLEDEDDPAAGKWEFPGGHHEDGDLTSLHAGIREWEEEVGVSFPAGAVVQGTWTSDDGVYQGHVVVIPEERKLILTEGRDVDNPDDPDGDASEQVAWWDPEDAKKNPALRDECSKTPWNMLKSAHKEGSTMDTPDEFGSLFEGVPTPNAPVAPVPRLAASASEGDEWGLEVSYNYAPDEFASVTAPITHSPDQTMDEAFTSAAHPFDQPRHYERDADVIDAGGEDAALPVTYGDEEPDKVATQLQAALAASGSTANSKPSPVGTSHLAGLPVCPKCNSTIGEGQDLEIVSGVGIQHKGECPRSDKTSAAHLPGETEEERGRRLLAYVEARQRGETPPGPDPFAHLAAESDSSEFQAAASQYLAKKGGISTEALKSYSAPERQAIIDEGEGEEGASNLDRLDIKGTHYEAMGQTVSSVAVLARTLNDGRDVPEDEDMTFLAGDPNLSD